MKDWFTIDKIDEYTYVISEYRHWEETHCYLLNGKERSLLIDTGLGICNISEVIEKIIDKPVTAVATHIHWDHIGGHKYYPDFYAHEAELSWLNGGFPLPIQVAEIWWQNGVNCRMALTSTPMRYSRGNRLVYWKRVTSLTWEAEPFRFCIRRGILRDTSAFGKRREGTFSPVIWYIKGHCMQTIHPQTLKAI